MRQIDWENFYSNSPTPFWEIPVEILLELQRNIESSLSVMDVGCGEGALLRRLNALGFQHLHGIDFSFEAVRRARRNVPSAIIGRLDIETEEIDRYDLIFFHLVLPFMKEKQLVMEKLVKSAGRLIVSVPVVNGSAPTMSGTGCKAMSCKDLEETLSRTKARSVELIYSESRLDKYRSNIYSVEA